MTQARSHGPPAPVDYAQASDEAVCMHLGVPRTISRCSPFFLQVWGCPGAHIGARVRSASRRQASPAQRRNRDQPSCRPPRYCCGCHGDGAEMVVTSIRAGNPKGDPGDWFCPHPCGAGTGAVQQLYAACRGGTGQGSALAPAAGWQIRPQIAAARDPPLAAARLEALARPPAAARGEGQAGRAARRVDGADTPGPQR